MASKLVMCSACGVAMRSDEDACPHCGVARRFVSAPIASGAILLGLALAGCPADDGTETMGGTGSASMSASTETASGSSTMSGGASQSSTSASTTDSTTTDDPSGSVSAQPPYGVPDTTTGGPDDTDTETDTDGDTTTGGFKLDLPDDAG